VVDAVALVAFVMVGVVRHDEGLALVAFARTGLPLLAAWFLVALPVGTYRRPGWLTLLTTWVLAVPAGLILRSLVRGGPWGHGLLVFGGVAMAFTALFLIAGRLLLLVPAAVRRRRSDRTAPRRGEVR
jgi:hypothetical protein